MQRLRQLLMIALMCQISAGMVIGEERAQTAQPGEMRPRARDIGVAPGVLRPGALNAITDINGVSVGHVTLIEGSGIRTGVTAILPHAGNLFQDKVPAGFAAGNGFGKFAGATHRPCSFYPRGDSLLLGTASCVRAR